jgi:uncharacterized membrane protein
LWPASLAQTDPAAAESTLQSPTKKMHLVALAWIYVVLMMALAEALSPQGTVLGAIFTFLLYGVLPLSIVLYVMGAPMRRRARRRAEATQASAADPDGGGQPPGEAVAAVGKEP